jgi:plastocyanin
MRKLLTIIITSIIFLTIGIVSSGARPVDSAFDPVAATAPQTARVTIGNFKFTPPVLTVTVGTTVEWVNEGGRHTVEADNKAFKSDVLGNGAKFQFKFDKPGTYQYYCGFHGEKGGKDMSAKIIVKKK